MRANIFKNLLFTFLCLIKFNTAAEQPLSAGDIISDPANMKLASRETPIPEKMRIVAQLGKNNDLKSAIILYGYLSRLTQEMTYKQLVTKYASDNIQFIILEIEKAVASFTDPKAVNFFAGKARVNKDVLRLSILQGLKKVQSPVADNLFEQFLTHKTEMRTCIIAVEAAGFRKMKSMIPALIGFAADKENPFGLRCASIRALSRMPDARSVEPLINIHTESGRLKAEAKNALWTITGQILDHESHYKTWWEKNKDTYVPPAFPVLHFNAELKSSEGWNNFYGLPLFADRILFILDRSGSMSPSLSECKEKILSIVRSMGSEKEFNVIFFNEGLSYWKITTTGLAPATEENIKNLRDYFDRISAEGKTLTERAVYTALAFMGPMCNLETAFIITDGEHNSGERRIEANLEHLNRYLGIRIHTLNPVAGNSFVSGYPKNSRRFYSNKPFVQNPRLHLKRIASEHDGLYTEIRKPKEDRRNHNLTQKVSLDEVKTPFTQVVRKLAEASNNIFTVSYALREKEPDITLKASDISLGDALWWIAWQADAECVLRKSSIFFFIKGEKPPLESKPLPKGSTSDIRKTALTYSFDDIPLKQAIGKLADQAGLIISMKDKIVPFTVRCAGYKVSAGDAVKNMLTDTGLSYCLRRGGIIIYRNKSSSIRCQTLPGTMGKPVSIRCLREPLSRFRAFIKETAPDKKLFIDREALKPLNRYNEEGLRPVFLTLNINNMQLDHVLYWVGRQAGLAYTVRDYHIIFSIKDKLKDYRRAVPEKHKSEEWYKKIEKKLDTEIGRFWLPEELHLAIRFLQDRSGINIIADPSVISTYGSRYISLDDLKGFTFRDYLNLLTETPGLYYVISHGAVLICESSDGEFNPPVVKKKAKDEISKTAQKSDDIKISEESLLTAEQLFIAQLKTPITIDMQNVPFWYAVAEINKKLEGVNLCFTDICSTDSISLSLKGVTAEYAFKEIAQKAGLDCVIDHDNLKVVFGHLNNLSPKALGSPK